MVAAPAREPAIAARDGAPAATGDDGEMAFKEALSLAPVRRSGWLLDQAATFASFKKAGAPVVLGTPKHHGWARYAHQRRADVRFVRPLDLPSPND